MRILRWSAMPSLVLGTTLFACTSQTGSSPSQNAGKSSPASSSVHTASKTVRIPIATIPASAETKTATGVAVWEYYRALPGSGYNISIVGRNEAHKILDVVRVAQGKDTKKKQPVLKLRYNHSGGQLIYAYGKILKNTLQSEHMAYVSHLADDLKAKSAELPYGCTADIVAGAGTGAATGVACALAVTTPLTGPVGVGGLITCLAGLVSVAGTSISIDDDCKDPTTGQQTDSYYDIQTGTDGNLYLCQLAYPGGPPVGTCQQIDPTTACEALDYGCDSADDGAGHCDENGNDIYTGLPCRAPTSSPDNGSGQCDENGNDVYTGLPCAPPTDDNGGTSGSNTGDNGGQSTGTDDGTDDGSGDTCSTDDTCY
jgi:hypothetical protein